MADYLLDYSFVLVVASVVFMPIALFCGIMEKILDKYNLWDKIEKFFDETED